MHKLLQKPHHLGKKKKKKDSISLVMALHPAEYADVWITIKEGGVDGRAALMELMGFREDSRRRFQ